MLRLAPIMDVEVLFTAATPIDIHHYSFWMLVQCTGYVKDVYL